MQTIGERLEEARKRKGISIREAAEATKIRGDYLQKFESNQFDLGLAELYVRGFLRSYSAFLKLPAEKVVADFNALGGGASSSRRTPSREVYGRMDLSVASADEDAAAPAAAAATAPDQNAGGSPQRTFSRGGGSGMPAGPMIDPNLVVKGGIAVIVIVLLGLVAWAIKAMVGGGDTPTAQKGGATPPAAVTQKVIAFVALGPTEVQIKNALPDGKGGYVAGTETLFRTQPGVPLTRGERRELLRAGALYVIATKGENLQIELDGKTHPSGFTGHAAAVIPAP